MKISEQTRSKIGTKGSKKCVNKKGLKEKLTYVILELYFSKKSKKVNK